MGGNQNKPIYCIVCDTLVNEDRPYYRRYRTCRACASRERVMLRGAPHRFCQQCGKYEPVESFDVGTRTCRVALARHAERRRIQSEKKRQQNKSDDAQEASRPWKRHANVFYPKPVHVASANPVEASLAEEKRTAIFASARSQCLKYGTIQRISEGNEISPSQVLGTLHGIIRSYFYPPRNGGGGRNNANGDSSVSTDSTESSESTEDVEDQVRELVRARHTISDEDMQRVVEILNWCLASKGQNMRPNPES